MFSYKLFLVLFFAISQYDLIDADSSEILYRRKRNEEVKENVCTCSNAEIEQLKKDLTKRIEVLESKHYNTNQSPESQEVTTEEGIIGKDCSEHELNTKNSELLGLLRQLERDLTAEKRKNDLLNNHCNNLEEQLDVLTMQKSKILTEEMKLKQQMNNMTNAEVTMKNTNVTTVNETVNGTITN